MPTVTWQGGIASSQAWLTCLETLPKLWDLTAGAREPATAWEASAGLGMCWEGFSPHFRSAVIRPLPFIELTEAVFSPSLLQDGPV